MCSVCRWIGIPSYLEFGELMRLLPFPPAYRCGCSVDDCPCLLMVPAGVIPLPPVYIHHTSVLCSSRIHAAAIALVIAVD